MEFAVAKRFPIIHPKANQISIGRGEGFYSGEDTAEIAFFMNGEWVLDPIEPFADYRDSFEGSTTLVYCYVPNELIDAFLDENGV